MYAVDRSVALIKPKQPFLDWLMNLPGSDLDIGLDQLSTDCTVILTPEFDEIEDALSFLDEAYSRIFELELTSWCEEPKLWPQARTIQLFWKWFEVDLHSTVVDMVDDSGDTAPLS